MSSCARRTVGAASTCASGIFSDRRLCNFSDVPGSSSTIRMRNMTLLLWLPFPRDGDDELRPLCVERVVVDTSPVGSDDAAHETEAEARADVILTRAPTEEVIEDVVFVLGRNAGAVVAVGDDGGVARRGLLLLEQDADPQPAVASHRDRKSGVEGKRGDRGG